METGELWNATSQPSLGGRGTPKTRNRSRALGLGSLRDIGSGYLGPPGHGQPVQNRFGFQRKKAWHCGGQPRQQATHNGRGKAASRHFLRGMMIPRQRNIHTSGREFDKMAWLVEEAVIVFGAEPFTVTTLGKYPGHSGVVKS